MTTTNDIRTPFKGSLRAALKAHSITAATLSRRTGIDHAELSRMSHRGMRPTPEQAVKIARALEVH